MHPPSSFPVWEGLRHNPNVRMTFLAEGGLLWPWETMHEEGLAWCDHWLKGRDTGVMDGPPIRYVIPGTDDWRTRTPGRRPRATTSPTRCAPTAGLARTRAIRERAATSTCRPTPDARTTPTRRRCPTV